MAVNFNWPVPQQVLQWRREAEARAAGIAKHGACPYCEGKGKIPWVPPQVYGETGPAYAARLQNETRVESCGKCRGTGYKGSEYSILNPE